MTCKRISKVLLVWLCIITLLMPFCSEVLATALTKQSTTAVLETIAMRSCGYSYKIGDHDVLKITQSKNSLVEDVFYCVNAEKSFSISSNGYHYKKVANDFTDYEDNEVTKWATTLGLTKQTHTALVNLLNNVYLLNQPEYKDEFLTKAFDEYLKKEEETTPPTTIETIKSKLTDDDIDVVQQWAIWYFTNGTEIAHNDIGDDEDSNNVVSIAEGEDKYHKECYNTLSSVKICSAVSEVPGFGSPEDMTDKIREEYMKELFNYLIKFARQSTDSPSPAERTYPSIEKGNNVTSEIVDNTHYKVGPFKVNKGNTTPTDLKLTLTNQKGEEISNYEIYVGEEKSNKKIDEIFDEEYYIYIPVENNTITKVSLKLSYTKLGGRDISLWDKDESQEQEKPDLQPVVLIIPEPAEEVSEEAVGKIDQKIYDLALRKYVVSINGETVEDRAPKNPTTENLKALADGSIDTLEYRHPKKALEVKKGDKIVYEFRIYNEGDINAKVSEIVDYLPEGLTVVDKKDSDVNSKYNWTVEDNKAVSSYLANTEIPAFNKERLEISYGKIQLECEVTGNLKTGKTLTNVAEIVTDDGFDRDSHEHSFSQDSINDNYSGNPNHNNGGNLGDGNYHYEGLEDDDDFEKVIIEGDLFDLNLKKFISKVNNETLSREPSVNVEPLNNGADDATYSTTKTPVNVKTGDIVTFTLRVYNEGDTSGYAEQITDYIPEGLGFLEGYKTNYDNYWSISENEKNSVKLSTIKDGMNNVKLEDFKDVESLENVEVILGKTKVTSKALSSELTDSNLIPAFNGSRLEYKDIQISCIVVTEDEITLKNIAAITAEKDENKNPVDTDRGSEDRDSTPKDDINPDNYGTGNEDDDDYDVVKTDKKDFDLSLRKFITGVNDSEVANRAPSVVMGSDGKLQYNHQKDSVKVHNGDLIKYTIRVYNEGQVDGYAAEVTDNIPKGLVFVPDNETNQKYGWKMYDASGNETNDAKQAVSVKTDYLSKAKSENNLIPAFNKDAGVSDSNPSHKDVELVFRMDETLINKTVTTSERTLINIAEISKNTDRDGNDIPDIDSTPGNGNQNEDDIDKEQVYVEYFDLALEKDLTKALVTVDGKTTELNVAKGETIKVDVNRKKLSTTTIKFVYDIIVRNEGEIEGYATEVTDYIPEGLSFDPADNPNWSQVSGRVITTNALAKTLLQPGQSTTVPVTLTWERSEQNMGEFVNVAEITEHWNPYGSPDVDSTPNNQVPTEDDYDNAPVYVGIVTGLTGRPYIVLTSAVLLILGTGIILIKKYVLSN